MLWAWTLPAPDLYPWATQLIGSGQALAWEGSLTGMEGFIRADHILEQERDPNAI